MLLPLSNELHGGTVIQLSDGTITPETNNDGSFKQIIRNELSTVQKKPC